jgi:ABC-type Fe3+-hydroxamate transport system substrate-binding protein
VVKVAQRLVSLVPSSTDSVCRLGAAAALVGCTSYCTEPAAALTAVARVGGTKNPNLEAILRLAPDLVLGNAEENRPQDLEFLAARVPVLVQTPRTVAAAIADVGQLAERLGTPVAAAAAFCELASAAVRAIPAAPAPLRACYVIWRKPWMSISADTYIHDVMRLVGLHNVCASAMARYPEVEPAAIVASGIDVVLLASEPWEFDAAQATELRAARTFGDATLLLCDGRDFCWHGTRLVTGLRRASELVATARAQLSGPCQ